MSKVLEDVVANHEVERRRAPIVDHRACGPAVLLAQVFAHLDSDAVRRRERGLHPGESPAESAADVENARYRNPDVGEIACDECGAPRGVRGRFGPGAGAAIEALVVGLVEDMADRGLAHPPTLPKGADPDSSEDRCLARDSATPASIPVRSVARDRQLDSGARIRRPGPRAQPDQSPSRRRSSMVSTMLSRSTPTSSSTCRLVMVSGGDSTLR